MKFFTIILLLSVAVLSVLSAENPFCKICSDQFPVPEDWAMVKTLIYMGGCPQLGSASAKALCSKLLDATDLTSSWPDMRPHVALLRQEGCKKYCS